MLRRIAPGIHAVNTSNRFAPPKASLDAAPDAPAIRKRFTWLFVLRYLVGAYVLVSALISLYGLSQSWARLVDRAIIDPLWSPYRYLPAIVLKVATGASLLARSKLSLVGTLLWAAAFVYLLWGNGPLTSLGSDFFLNFGTLVAFFAFQCLLLTRGLLR